MTDCIFCKITAGETNTKFIYEDDQIVVFPDLYPKAKTHLLITPKQHISSLMDVNMEDAQLMAHMLCMMPHIAKQLGIKGFRTIINTGKEGGQEIPHLHFHLLAGNLPKFI